MRVLSLGSVYPPHLLGGYEVIWQGVNRRLLAEGHASRVLVTDYVNPEVTSNTSADGAATGPAGPLEDVHRELDWYWRDHTWPPFNLRQSAAIERHNAAVLERHLREFRPDVVAFWPMGGMSLSLITHVQRAGIPAVFFLLDPWPIYGPAHDRWLARWSRIRRPRLQALAERLTGLPTTLDLTRGRWIFCSEWMRSGSGLSLDPGQESVLTPGVEPRYTEAEPVPVDRRWSWRLLFLSRVVEQKGVITAVEALAHLPAEATLTIVGQGDAEYRAELEQRAGDLGVSDRITFLPQVGRDATLELYRRADVLLHPVLWAEPWGLVPLEAMALGIPVVATGRGGSGEFLSDGVNALLHPPGDAEHLARAVTRLAENPDLRRELVRAGHRTADTHTAAAFDRAAVAELRAHRHSA